MVSFEISVHCSFSVSMSHERLSSLRSKLVKYPNFHNINTNISVVIFLDPVYPFYSSLICEVQLMFASPKTRDVISRDLTYCLFGYHPFSDPKVENRFICTWSRPSYSASSSNDLDSAILLSLFYDFKRNCNSYV